MQYGYGTKKHKVYSKNHKDFVYLCAFFVSLCAIPAGNNLINWPLVHLGDFFAILHAKIAIVII